MARDKSVRMTDGDANFRALVETIDDIILITDLEGRLLYANPATSVTLGYDADELVGMSILDLHCPSMRAEVTAIMEGMANGTRDHCPLPFRHRNGTLVPIETRVWRGTWNGTECIFGICKHLGKEQEALQRLERFFRMNPALMAVSRVPDRVFLDVNDAFLRVLGYDLDEVIGRSSAELGLFIEPAVQEQVARRLADEGFVRDVELQVRRKDGSVIDGLFSGELIRSQGAIYTLTVMVDITKRQQTVRELRAALEEIRELQGFLPICAGCKKIRDDGGYWQQVDTYLTRHIGTQFSHGMCPECLDRMYPEYRKPDA